MKAYSHDLREHILQAVDQGHSRAEIVNMFGISLSTLKRYRKQRAETGDVAPKPIPGRPSKKYAALEAGLVPQLEAYPDLTLEAHCHLWERTHGMTVDHTQMSRAIHRVGWTRKKRRWEPRSGTSKHEADGEPTESTFPWINSSSWMNAAPTLP